MSGVSSRYENETSSKATFPRGSSMRTGVPESAEATPLCMRLAIEATWVSGWVNWREYWMKAWTSPRLIVPLATRSPPTTAIAT